MGLKILHFTSGEVVIGKFEDDTLTLPFLMDYIKPKDSEVPVLTLIPYIVFAAGFKLNLNPNNIVWKADVSELLQKDYDLALENLFKMTNEQAKEE